MDRSSQIANNLTLRLLPASQFALDKLTEVYNQSRADYLVPMQINAGTFASYIKWYDIDLDRSFVALDGSLPAGLIMLGVRPGHTWFTRLGVLPGQRRHGTGRILMQALKDQTRLLEAATGILEVISGNNHAHKLFLSLGFRETRELLVLRRAAGTAPYPLGGATINWLDRDQSVNLLHHFPGSLPWTNESQSMVNGGDCLGLRADLGLVGQGWLIFRRQAGLLSHLVYHTESGDAQQVAAVLTSALNQRFPALETYAENIPVNDPHVPVLGKMGFTEVFRRIEMCWETGLEQV